MIIWRNFNEKKTNVKALLCGTVLPEIFFTEIFQKVVIQKFRKIHSVCHRVMRSHKFFSLNLRQIIVCTYILSCFHGFCFSSEIKFLIFPHCLKRTFFLPYAMKHLENCIQYLWHRRRSNFFLSTFFFVKLTDEGYQSKFCRNAISRKKKDFMAHFFHFV